MSKYAIICHKMYYIWYTYFSTNICKKKKIVNINSKNVYNLLNVYSKLLNNKILRKYLIKFKLQINANEYEKKKKIYKLVFDLLKLNFHKLSIL
jgi:hypothetical protein